MNPLSKRALFEPEADLISYLSYARQAFDDDLKRWFSARPTRLDESMAYSLFLPSKRLRPLFCLEVAKAMGGQAEVAMPAAMALEMVHTYSLIHDDLPAMDDDDLRRGQPTNHKVFGDAHAILAGDALLTLAFETLALAGQVSADIRVRWIEELAKAAGREGMVLGQAIDIEQTTARDTLLLEDLHRKKTGALLAASVVMGAIAVGASREACEKLREFALDMGLAFQIQDDILDVIGGAEMGKPVKSDERNAKDTYVSILGLDEAKNQAEFWFEKSMRSLKEIAFGYPHRLEDLTRYVILRKT